MGDQILQNKVNLFVMKGGEQDGKGTGLSALSIDRHSMSGKSDGTIPGRGQDYGYDVHGRIRVKNIFQEAPGGLLTATIEFDKGVDIDYLEKRRRDQQEFGLWESSAPCARRDNPFGWIENGRLDFHGKVTVSGFNGGDAPSRDGSATPVVSSADITYAYDLTLRPLAVSSVTPEVATNVEAVNTIFGLKEPKVPGCAPGYRGPDEHLYIGSGITAAPGEAHYSRDGGGIWTSFTNKPFGAGIDGIADGAVAMISGTSPRVVWGNDTGTLGLAIAYGDAEIGNEAATSWTIVQINAVAADYATVMLWPWYDALYVAGGTAGDDLWLSTDSGETFTEKVVGSGDQINAIAKGFGQDCEDIYLAGASNLLLVDAGRSGTFVALNGPTGSDDSYALAVDNDGNLYLGNGTSLFISTDKGATAGGWTLLKDFGASMVVQDIFFPQGDSNHIYVVVDDTTPGNGSFWHSNDKGNAWRQIPPRTNGGYNKGYQSSEDDNLLYAVGDADGGYGQVHRATPTTAGC